MKNTKAKHKTNFSTIRKYNSNKESFCMFILTSQLQASPSNEISDSYSTLKNCVKNRIKGIHRQKLAQNLRFQVTWTEEKCKLNASHCYYSTKIDGFPKLSFSYLVLNTHVHGVNYLFFHSTNICKLMQ